MPDATLTDRETETLEFIKKYRQENDFSPTYREIGDALGVSFVRAKQIVDLMKNKGVVTYTPGKNRTIKEIE